MTNSAPSPATTRRARVTCTAALGLGLGAALLAGCGNGVEAATGDPSATVTPTTSSSATPAPPTRTTTTSTGSPGGSSGGSSGGGAPASPTTPSRPTSSICAASELQVFDESPADGGAAGSAYLLIYFKNVSSRTCYLDGHPGVSFVGKGNGTQLGRPATFVGSTTPRMKLVPGDRVHARLQIADPGVYGDDCAPVTPDGFRVYAPDSRASVFVPSTSLQACSKNLPGGRSQLHVTAVGTV